MEYNTTHPPISIHPYTLEEFNQLKATMDSISVRLPDNMQGFVWNNYNKIRGVNEKQPCGCQAAAGHWVSAVNFLKEWVKERSL